MDNTKLHLGQTLYTFGEKNSIDEYVVTKIGRKYFYINDGLYQRNFNIDTLFFHCKEWSHRHLQLYRTKQEIIDIRIKRHIYSTLRGIFSSYSNSGLSLTLDQLKQIADILKIEY